MNKTRTDKMVDRFLCWMLPKDFAPDAGISFKPTKPDGHGTHWWPVGTNLLTAEQARQMLAEVAPPDDEMLDLVQNTANMLRGMTMDPGIAAHAKDAMRSRIAELEAAVDARIDG